MACEELHIRPDLKDRGELKVVGQKPGRILFRYSGDAQRLLSLRSAEHVLIVVRHLQDMTRSRHSLANLKKSLGRIDFRPFLELCRKAGIRLRHQTTFRVTSRMSGLRNYRRIDAQHVVEQALAAYGWRLTDENPALDVWVEIHGEEAYVSLRLSPIELAQREYKQAHIPASLKPTVAYCLVQLSDPQPNDVFLDAMCGAGTILIERAYSGRYRYLLGGDLSVEALQAAQTNIGRKHRPRQLFHWDARALPLARWSVDKIVCNLPFGEQIGDESETRRLYPQLLKEFERVLKPTGRMVLLTTQQSILEHQLLRQKSFKVAQKFGIDLLGQNPWAYLCVPC